MFTKKNVLLVSGLIGGILLLLEPIKTSTLCGIGATTCIDTVFFIAMILFIFPFVLPFSLVTYFLPESVFRAWITFAKWWVPAQIILVLFTPESSGGFFVSIIDKQLVAIVFSGIFTVISLLIVLISWFRSRAS